MMQNTYGTGPAGGTGPSGSGAEIVDISAGEVPASGENGHRKSVVVIPTYNEAPNLELLVSSVLQAGAFDVLVVDDNSPDGTGDLADTLAKRHVGRVAVLHRPEKQGLGIAYQEGFRYALGMGYQLIFTMDADLSHDAESLPALRGALTDADVALGSRYVAGGGTQHWPLWRRLLSRCGSAYAQFILGLPVRDLTGGFKGFRRSALESLLPDLDAIRSRGYAFQIETTYRCAQHGFHIVEVPILFTDRRAGKSKMHWSIVAEALWVVCALRLQAGLVPRQGSVRPHEGTPLRKRITKPRALTAGAVGACLLLLGAVFAAPHLIPGHERQLAHAHTVSSADPHPTPIPATATPASSADVRIQGTTLTPNVPFTFAGSEFAPNEPLTATIESTQGRTEARLGAFMADHAGTVNMTWQALLPSLAPGGYTLVVTGERSGRIARTPFQLRWIPPNVMLSSFSVKPRQGIDFTGGGFHAQETVDVHLGNIASAPLASAPTNAGGNLTGHVTMPPLPAGSYTLYFVGRQSQTPVKVHFLVRGFHPWVVLSTYVPTPHSRLGFNGQDFAPGEEVLVYLNQQRSDPIARLHADGEGRLVAPAAWEVTAPQGPATLIFAGQQSGTTATVPLTVLSKADGGSG